MPKNYYYLVAGLKEYSLDSERKGFDAPGLRNMILEELTERDQEYVKLFYAFYDVENLMAALNGKTAFNALGMLSPEEIRAEITGRSADPEEDFESKLPAPVAAVIQTYRDRDNEEETGDEEQASPHRPVETMLWEAFYGECARSECRFLREWYAFDNTLRNICTAYIARDKELEIAGQLVGEGEIIEALSRSTASDFGLKNEIDYLEQIIALLDTKDIIEKEQQLDLIRWKKAEELSIFDYFDIQVILAYLAKINIIHRWVALDPKRGKEMFDTLMRELSGGEAIRKAEDEANA